MLKVCIYVHAHVNQDAEATCKSKQQGRSRYYARAVNVKQASLQMLPFKRLALEIAT